MYISELNLTNFRNHRSTDIRFGQKLNIITGPNGVGKTNLIDAIHYLCMSRSFVSGTDQYVANFYEKEFRVNGSFHGNIRSKFDVGCSWSRGIGKKIFVNESPLDKLSDLIGMVPVVVLGPDDKRLTNDGPIERRSFLDSFISQLSSGYLRDLLDYRRVIRQRNSLLSQSTGKSNSSIRSTLEPWNDQFVNLASRITQRRFETLQRFQSYMESVYTDIAGIGLKPRLEYKSQIREIVELNKIEEQFKELLESHFDREIERQQTVIGPHRDDIIFYLNDMELRKYGSQGQHRIFAISLKFAQRNFYEDELDDLPIFLLDDVFGDLDPDKTRILMDLLARCKGQTFITSANKQLFSRFVDPIDGEIHYYDIGLDTQGHPTVIYTAVTEI